MWDAAGQNGLRCLWAIALLGCAAGCFDNFNAALPVDDAGNPTDAGRDAGPFDAGSPRPDAGNDAGNDAGTADAGGITLTATWVVHHFTDTGQVNVPVDLSRAPVAALVPNAATDGGYDLYPGVGTDAGTLAVPGFPASVGTYYLHVSTFWIEATARTLDLSQYTVGRPVRAFADAGTTVVMSTNGMQVGLPSNLALTSGGAGFVEAVTASVNGSGVGTATLDVSGLALIDATQGDSAFVYQEVISRAAGVQTVAAAAGAGPLSTTVLDGIANALDAGLVPLAQQPVQWLFKGSAFDALQSEVGPSAVTTQQQASVMGVLGGGRFGPLSPAPLLTATVLDAGAGDVWLLGSFGNPLPTSSWGLLAISQEHWTVTYMVPIGGGSVADPQTARVENYDLLATAPSLDGGALAPFIGPPTRVQLDGQDAGVALSLASTAPVLSWSAPSLGVPNHYEVTVFRPTFTLTGKLQHSTSVVYTTETSVRLFPGMLLPASSYFIRVEAVYRPGSPFFQSPPLASSVPTGIADAMTGLLATP